MEADATESDVNDHHNRFNTLVMYYTIETYDVRTNDWDFRTGKSTTSAPRAGTTFSIVDGVFGAAHFEAGKWTQSPSGFYTGKFNNNYKNLDAEATRDVLKFAREADWR